MVNIKVKLDFSCQENLLQDLSDGKPPALHLPVLISRSWLLRACGSLLLTCLPFVNLSCLSLLPGT